MRASLAAAISRVAGPRSVPRSGPHLVVWLVVVAVLVGFPGLWLRGDAFLGLVRAELRGSGPLLGGWSIGPYWETWRGNADVRSWPQLTTVGNATAIALLVAAAGEALADRWTMLVGIVLLSLVAAALLLATAILGVGPELLAAVVVALLAAATAWRVPPRPASA